MNTYILPTYKYTSEGIFPSFLVCLVLSVSSELCCAVVQLFWGDWSSMLVSPPPSDCSSSRTALASIQVRKEELQTHMCIPASAVSQWQTASLSHTLPPLSLSLSFSHTHAHPSLPFSLLSDRAFLLFLLVFMSCISSLFLSMACSGFSGSCLLYHQLTSG